MNRRPVLLVPALLSLAALLNMHPRSLAQDASTTGPELGLELLFSEADVATMRQNSRLPIFEEYWNEVSNLDAAEDGNFMREAFVYLITGDETRGRNARRLVLEQASEEYWNRFVDGELRLGFLTAGRLTAWMALSYDWLYDLFSEDERALIREAIAEKGCVPLYRSLHGMRYPETVTGWSYAPYAPPEPRLDLDMSRWPHILGHNNFRAIINGGLTLGLLVLEGHDERVDEWREMVLDSILRFNALLKDDGSYDEAVAYLNYAMTYQIYAMEAARRHLGVDFFDSANFQGTIDYVLAMYMPTYQYGHGSLTFGDAGNSLRSATSFWVARHARDGLAQTLGLKYSDHDLFSLLYYDPTVRPEIPTEAGHFVELDLDWITSRSGYEVDDLVVGMRSGGPMNHEHGDRNSIQLKAYGEILLADHRKLTYFARDPEWTMRTSLGHNTILIDGVGHPYHQGEEGTNESKSHARIVRAGRRPGYHFWASDATQAYRLVNPDVRSVTRSILSFPDAPAIVVMDKVIKESEPSIVTARWHVENGDGLGSLEVGHDSGGDDSTIDNSGRDSSDSDGTFTIERMEGRLFAAVAGNSDQKLVPGSFDSPNKEHPFIFVDVADADSLLETFKVMVGIPLRPQEPDPMVEFSHKGTEWTIQIRKGGSVILLRAFDEGVLPEFEVRRNDF